MADTNEQPTLLGEGTETPKKPRRLRSPVAAKSKKPAVKRTAVKRTKASARADDLTHFNGEVKPAPVTEDLPLEKEVPTSSEKVVSSTHVKTEPAPAAESVPAAEPVVNHAPVKVAEPPKVTEWSPEGRSPAPVVTVAPPVETPTRETAPPVESQRPE
ncbi:MAG TPA: hypothetical protein VGD78_10465, partial [Chthoniobacterales bacterium]